MIDLSAAAHVALVTLPEVEGVVIFDTGIKAVYSKPAEGRQYPNGAVIDTPETRFAKVAARRLRDGDDPAELLRLGAFIAGGDPSTAVVPAEEHAAARRAILICLWLKVHIDMTAESAEEFDAPYPDFGIFVIWRKTMTASMTPALDLSVCDDARAFQSVHNRQKLAERARKFSQLSLAARARRAE